jgi:hypothetical protein
MTPEDIRMHLAVGRYYGKDASCGYKIRFETEESADKQLANFTASGKMNKSLEVYPCYWCSETRIDSVPDEFGVPDYVQLNWHLGRAMDTVEKTLFSDVAVHILEQEEIVLHVAEPVSGIQIGETKLRVHNRKLCEGQACSVHNPSSHHMNTWSLNWRGDRRIMERLCVHGIGHPDPDDCAYRKTRDGKNYDPGVHGCDGCCIAPQKGEQA